MCSTSHLCNFRSRGTFLLRFSVCKPSKVSSPRCAQRERPGTCLRLVGTCLLTCESSLQNRTWNCTRDLADSEANFPKFQSTRSRKILNLFSIGQKFCKPYIFRCLKTTYELQTSKFEFGACIPTLCFLYHVRNLIGLPIGVTVTWACYFE